MNASFVLKTLIIIKRINGLQTVLFQRLYYLFSSLQKIIFFYIFLII